MSGIVSLEPLDGGDLIQVPNEKTVIGRGTFLQVSDKRVSRSHATIEINNGKLIIVPTHTNPCFYKHKGSGPQLVLAKDKPKTLEEGDVLSLLPDKLFFKIIYQNKKKSNLEESEGENGEDDGVDEEEEVPKNKKIKPIAKRNGDSAALSKKSKNSVQKPKPAAKTAPVGRGRAAKRAHSEEASEGDAGVGDDDADDVDYQEDDDDDDDYGKKRKPKPKKKNNSHAKKTNGRTTRRRSRHDDDDDDSSQRKRRPRAVTQKRPRYTDDDFVMSDEEFEIEEAVDVEEKQDSDFVAEDVDSGSDWGSKKKKVPTATLR